METGKMWVIGMGFPRFADERIPSQDLSEADRQFYFRADIWHVLGGTEYHYALHCPEAIALSNHAPEDMQNGPGGLPCCPKCVACLE